MSNFTYPPPPPPPPPLQSNPNPSSQVHQGGRRIPSFQDGHSGRGRTSDGRGTYQGGRGGHQHRQTPQHTISPSGGIGVAINPQLQPAYPPASYAQHGYHNVGQHYGAQPAATWSTPQPYAYTTATAPAPLPYGNQYATPQVPHQSSQSYGPVPVPNIAYGSQYAGYPVPNGTAYPIGTHAHPVAHPSTPAANVQAAYRDQTASQHQSHYNIRSAESKTGDLYDHGHSQKRKREHSPHRSYGKPGHSNPPSRGGGSARGGSVHVNKPKVLTAPSVPSFGFHALPPRPPPAASVNGFNAKEQKDRKQQKKRKTNQLGLTPKGDVHDVTDEEIDEEAAFAGSGATQMVEFRGRTVSLSTAAEIQAWIAERKKKFPTAARVAERKSLQEARKKQAEEKRKQRVEEQQKSAQQKRNDKKLSKKTKKNKKKDIDDNKAAANPASEVTLSKEELQRRRLEKHLRKAEKLRSMLEQSDIKDEQPNGDKAEKAAEQIPSFSDSSSDSSDSDSDAAPDIESVKERTVEPAAKSTATKAPRTNLMTVPCKYFIRDGHCRRKHCRFLHSLPPPEETKTLYERLKEQEIHKESLQTLDIIKQLGDRGLLDPDQ